MKYLRHLVFAIFLLALGLRLAWGLSQLNQGFLFVSDGDYTLYEIGAEHFSEHGDFTNSIFLVRPPLFPIIIALLQDNYTSIIILMRSWAH